MFLYLRVRYDYTYFRFSVHFLAPFFVRSLTLIPCSLLRNRTETLSLATQANQNVNEGK